MKISFFRIFMPITIVLLSFSFTNCQLDGKTEEEHLKIITQKLQAKYFNSDGTPCYYFEYTYCDPSGNTDPENWISVKIPVESFEVEILLTFDNKQEHFLVTFKPSSIGFVPGIIVNSKYYLLNGQWINIQRNYGCYIDDDGEKAVFPPGYGEGKNPFEENKIEKGNRYYMHVGASGPRGLAYKKNGDFVDLWSGHIYTKDEIKERLTFLNTAYGRFFTLNFASRL